MRNAIAMLAASLFCVTELSNVIPAFAAVCEDGKPVVKRASLETAPIDCGCFKHSPSGTRIFAVNVLDVTVATPLRNFSRSFDDDSVLKCDAEHLYVIGDHPTKRDPENFTFPLHETTVTLESAGEKFAVGPVNYKELARLQHLVKLGRARLVKIL